MSAVIICALCDQFGHRWRDCPSSIEIKLEPGIVPPMDFGSESSIYSGLDRRFSARSLSKWWAVAWGSVADALTLDIARRYAAFECGYYARWIDVCFSAWFESIEGGTWPCASPGDLEYARDLLRDYQAKISTYEIHKKNRTK